MRQSCLNLLLKIIMILIFLNLIVLNGCGRVNSDISQGNSKAQDANTSEMVAQGLLEQEKDESEQTPEQSGFLTKSKVPNIDSANISDNTGYLRRDKTTPELTSTVSSTPPPVLETTSTVRETPNASISQVQQIEATPQTAVVTQVASENNSKTNTSTASSIGVKSSNKSFSPNSNTVNFTNNAAESVTLRFVPNAGSPELSSITFAVGETKSVTFPNKWGGSFRDVLDEGYSGQWGEVKFNAWNNMLFYDMSNIPGQGKHGFYMTASDGGYSGVPRCLLDGAPKDALKPDGTLMTPKQLFNGQWQPVSNIPNVKQFGPEYPEWNTLSPSAKYLYSQQKKGDYYVGVGDQGGNDVYDDASSKGTKGSINVDIY